MLGQEEKQKIDRILQAHDYNKSQVIAIMQEVQKEYRYLPEELYYYIRSISYDLPRLVVGIAIIALGASIIRGKKKSLEDLDQN